MQISQVSRAISGKSKAAWQVPGNALLRSLLPEYFERLKPHLELVDLKIGQILYEMDDPIKWVFFPEVGLLSIISMMVSGVEIETSVVGREGGVGFVEALGGGKLHSRLIVQIPGAAYRVSPDHYRKAFKECESLRKAVHCQVELLLAESRQAIACHSLHKVESRFCRWLLECQDLSGGLDILPLKQEFFGRHVECSADHRQCNSKKNSSPRTHPLRPCEDQNLGPGRARTRRVRMQSYIASTSP